MNGTATGNRCAVPSSLYACVPQPSVRATPTGQVMPFGPWLQYPYGFFTSDRYCWWDSSVWQTIHWSMAAIEADQREAVVFGEVSEILRVERCQRKPFGKATRGDPGVVDRVDTATTPAVSRQVTP